MLGFGESLALLSAFSYAAANVCVAKSAANRGGDNGALLSIIMTAAVALSVWIASGALHGYRARYDDLPGLAWFALSGLLTIVVGRTLFFQSVARIGPIRASAVNRLNPFFSVLLAAILLGETIAPVAGAGMLLIAASFLILIRQVLRREAPAGPASPQDAPAPAMDYAFGPASALAYAVGYIARRFGLDTLPDPSFGTFVGASAGLAAYLLIALRSERYRAALRTLRSGTTRWHVMAASFISIGQLAQFAAISYIEVSRVVMITSAEIFIAMVLSVYVLKTERRPDPGTVAAAVIAMAGVVLITAG